jgi:hypothetical protein
MDQTPNQSKSGGRGIIIVLILLIVLIIIGVSVYFFWWKPKQTADACSAKDGTANVATHTLNSDNVCVAELCESGYGVDDDATPDMDGMCFAYVPSAPVNTTPVNTAMKNPFP